MTTKAQPAREDIRGQHRADRVVAALAAVLSAAESTDAFRLLVVGTVAVHGTIVGANGEVSICKTHIDALGRRGLIELARDEYTGPYRKLSTYRVTEAGHAALDEWMERTQP